MYKSNDRLLLKPETIGVGLRDFMISIKSKVSLNVMSIYQLILFVELVPSSARSSSSAATPLPTQFVPVLSDALEKVKEVIQRVLPLEKKLSALEEAEFEDDGGEEGALDREMLSQGMKASSASPQSDSFSSALKQHSDANATGLSTPCDHPWASRNGSGLYRCRDFASSGGLSCAES